MAQGPDLNPGTGPGGSRPQQARGVGQLHPAQEPANLADILERVLDKGIVIAGDIQINLLDIELLTIKIRLLVASVDRAREMGINWWESDPTLRVDPRQERVELRAEVEHEDPDGGLEARIERLERLLDGGESDREGQTATRRSATRVEEKASRPASARRATGSRGGNAQGR